MEKLPSISDLTASLIAWAADPSPRFPQHKAGYGNLLLAGVPVHIAADGGAVN